MSWGKAPLSSLGSVGRGKSRHRPRNDPSLYNGAYPFFQTGDVTSAEFYLSAYSQTYNEKGLAQSKIWDPATLCITIAANIAETAILKIPGCFPDSIVGFRADGSKSDVRFVKYALDMAKRDFQTISKGTTQDNLSVEKLLSINLPAPPVSEQIRIADILSAYDDLIDNNTRRISILENMAQSLFEEWFVNRRIAVEFADLDWAAGVIGDVFILQRGFDLPTSERTEGKYPVVAASGIHSYHNEFKVKGPGVTTGRSGTIGKFQYIEGDFWPLNTSLWIKEFKLGGPVFAFYLLSSLNLAKSDTGSAVPSLNRNIVHAMPTTIPPLALINAFEETVGDIRRAISVMSTSNTNLRTTRDLLLPKLISGEIEVRAAEEALEAAAA